MPKEGTAQDKEASPGGQQAEDRDLGLAVSSLCFSDFPQTCGFSAASRGIFLANAPAALLCGPPVSHQVTSPGSRDREEALRPPSWLAGPGAGLGKGMQPRLPH